MTRYYPEKPEPAFRGYEAIFAQWAQSNGWNVTKRGWPDFICRRNGALMAVEVKGGADDLKPEQIDTLDDLSAAGLPVFVYHHGLGLKKWRRQNSESVAHLKAEIGQLHAMIREMVGIRTEMVPGVELSRPEVRWTLETELDAVGEWCASEHGEVHRRKHTRMTFCAWVYLFDQRGYTGHQIADMSGEDFGTVRRYTVRATKAVERARAAQLRDIA